jgi:hypothetical protein
MSNLSLYEQKSIFRQNLTNVMLAGSFYMSCKMNNNLTQINSLLGKSLQIQQSIDLGIKQLNLQMAELIKIAKYQTMLMQKRDFEEKAGKQLRETIFHLHNEILNTMKSESSSIEKYFNLLSIKSSMLVNNVGTEMVDNFTDKKTIQDCYDTITNEMPNLENKFNEDEKKLALQLLDIIEVDEEDEIHKLKNADVAKKNKFLNERKVIIERLYKETPGYLFGAYTKYEFRKMIISHPNWKLHVPRSAHNDHIKNFYYNHEDDFLSEDEKNDDETYISDEWDQDGHPTANLFFDSMINWKNYDEWVWFTTEFLPRFYKISEADEDGKDFIERIESDYIEEYKVIPEKPDEDEENDNMRPTSFMEKLTGTKTYKEHFETFHFNEDVLEDAQRIKDYCFKAIEEEEKDFNIKLELLNDEKKMNELMENIKKEKEIITRLANQHTWMKPLFANRIDNNIDLTKNPIMQTETETSSSISPEPNIQTQTVSATQETNTNSTVQEKIHESVSKEQKLFNIELVSYESIARAAVAFRQLGIKYDPILKSALPVIFQENVPEEDALKIKAKLEEKDCTVNLIEKS